jgi:hypothetical protein
MTQMPHHDAQVTSPPAGLPPGTKRVVTFDTNAYRNLNRNKVRDLRQREREAGVFALANPIVIQELAAHVADEQDKDYRHCVSALAKLAEHTWSPHHPETGLCLLPDSQTTVCRRLFHVIPEYKPEIIQGLAMLARRIKELAPTISDPVVLLNCKLCAAFVKSQESKFHDRINQLLALVHAATVEEWVVLLAELAAKEHAATIRHTLLDAEVMIKARTLMEIFPSPLRLIATLLYNEQVNPAGSKRQSWGNFFWDYCVCFNAGVLNKIEDAPVYLVSGDRDVLKAAVEVNCADRVVSLPEHMKSVGLN